MLECPSCQQALPPAAHFCTRCGVRLSASKITGPAATLDFLVPITSDQPTQSLTNDLPIQETLLRAGSSDFFQQEPAENGWHEQERQAQPISPNNLEISANSVDPYAQQKLELAQQCTAITASMESLLPFVYENHRSENQALFASTLNGSLPLEDPVWGRVAFVLGAYGNYMYRYSLSTEQKQQVWRALLWAVFYERCYRRKYLAQRCQQFLHFFQGCAEDTDFLAYALDDLDRLSLYLEAGSLKKLQETLQQLPHPPADLLIRIGERLAVAQEKKARQAEQQNKISIAPKKEDRATAVVNSRASGKLQEKVLPQQQKPAATSLSHADKNARALPESSQVPRKAHLNEITPVAHELLSFFSNEQIQLFFVSIRSARLETVNSLLKSARRPLLATLLQELSIDGALECLAPRRPIRLGKKHADRFAEARRLLSSSRASEQLMGLRLFEQGARETTHPDYAHLAREWMLYARALVQGSPRAVEDWESNLQREEASWEEIWNLAAFYKQTGYPAESLRVLTPGLDELHAPVLHLRLALCCALYLLLEAERLGPLPQQHALPFLLAHLEQWPHPLSCLAWLLLAHESRGPLHPRQQSQRLSNFQELIEHPLSLPDPQKELPEARVATLEEVLTERVRCEEGWFLWINDYANRHPRKYQAWARLADTSERLNRLKSAEIALQHLVEIQYQHDFARYQEGTPPPRADYLRRNLEKLFEFYQRYGLTQEGRDAFHSCYPSLSHLWETHEPANRKLISLTRQYQEPSIQIQVPAISSHHARELSKTVTMPLEYFKPGQRVGIFVDYENIASFIPEERDAEEVGKALANYAAQFGEVVCQWASANPQNISNLADVRAGLEAAHFKVRFPRRELQFSQSKKNLADFALLECLSESQASHHLDIYLIVSGDRDYYERVCSLLDAGHTVRLIAATESPHLSQKYRELEQQRLREHRVTGSEEVDFFIDNLEEILCPLVPLN